MRSSWPNRALFCCFLVLAAATIVRAASETNLTFKAWEIEQGLPRSTVTAVTQTPDGYLWVGTENGLARFDGVRFSVFDSLTHPELRDDFVRRLYVDRQGRLWILAAGGMLYLREGNSFRNVSEQHGLANVRLMSVGEDSQSRIWVGDYQGGLRQLGPDGFSNPVTPSVNVPQEHRLPWDPHYFLDHIAPHESRGLWCIRGRRLFHFSDGVFTSPLDRPGRENLFWSILPARGGGLLAVSQQDGVLRLGPEFTVKQRWPYATSDSLVHSIHEDRDGIVWLAPFQKGLYRMAPDGTSRHLRFDEGLPGSDVRQVTEDHEGNLWLGTIGSGLVRMRTQMVRTYGTESGLPNRRVRSVAEDLEGRIWAGFSGGGLGQLTPDGRFVPSMLDPIGDVWGLVADRSEGLWLIDYRHGLQRFRGETVVPVPGFSGGYQCVYQDATGRVWIGFEYDTKSIAPGRAGGLARVHEGRIESLSWTGPPHNGVLAIAESAGGVLWLATDGGGLVRRAGENTFRVFTSQDGLPSLSLKDVAATAEGEVWVGTFGAGLCLYDGDRFLRLDSSLVASRYVYKLLIDGDDLWVASDAGLFRFNRRELRESTAAPRKDAPGLRMLKVDGLPSVDITDMARGRDGKLWLATAKGMAMVQTAMIRANTNPPPVQIEAVNFNEGQSRELAAISEMSSPLATADFGQITLPPGLKRLSVRFTAASFAEPARVAFRYRMEGVDESWITSTERRSAAYASLAPGRYAFHVQAANDQGIWNKAGARLAIQVQPFIWQTAWFRACLSGAGILAGALGLRRILHRRFVRHLEEVEQRHAQERAAHLESSNQQLQHRQVELEAALAKVKSLSGMIPICAGCKKIRDDRGFWERVEVYLQKHSEASFSHAMCPECMKEWYSDFLPKKPDGGGKEGPSV